jgi:hypothetical protein
MNTQGLLSALTRRNPKNSNQVSMGAMQWVLLYLSISLIGIIVDILHVTAEICWSTIMHELRVL